MSALLFSDVIAKRVLPRRLKKIVIDEISLVDKPACEECRVVLLKSDDKRTQDMETRNELIEKAGKVAELTLDVLAHNLRKLDPHLTEAQAFAKVYSDPKNVELRRAERMANGFGDYAKRAPTDVSEAGQIDFTKGEAKQWAFNKLQLLAAEMNEREPHLSHEQCFARCYAAPENIELRKAEREANGFVEYPAATGWRGALPPVARTEPGIEESTAYDKLKELAAESRRNNPFLTAEQAFARIMSDPGNRDLVRQEREASRRALGV